MERKWELDHKALERAYKELGIKHRVRYRILKKFWYLGNHLIRYDKQGLYHVVQLFAGMNLSLASKTIWHELTHAQQAERFGPTIANELYWSQMKEIGVYPSSRVLQTKEYTEVPLEAECYANELKYQYRKLVKKIQC